MSVEKNIFAYNLEDWWEKTFSNYEKNYISQKYQPLSTGIENQTTESTTSNYTPSIPDFIFLAQLSNWFLSKEGFDIARKVVEKAESLFDSSKADVLDLHFYYYNLLKFFYKNREDSVCYEKAKECCQKQIEISKKAKKCFKSEYKNSPLPSHPGYEQLCIIYEKEGKFEEAFALAQNAEKEGWNGDWEGRMKRLEKKMKKDAAKPRPIT